eukprot:scaffold4929_cov176-Amphora_coffeaeformis.AAC.5
MCRARSKVEFLALCHPTGTQDAGGLCGRRKGNGSIFNGMQQQNAGGENGTNILFRRHARQGIQ